MLYHEGHSCCLCIGIGCRANDMTAYLGERWLWVVADDSMDVHFSMPRLTVQHLLGETLTTRGSTLYFWFQANVELQACYTLLVYKMQNDDLTKQVRKSNVLFNSKTRHDVQCSAFRDFAFWWTWFNQNALWLQWITLSAVVSWPVIAKDAAVVATWLLSAGVK